MKLNKGFKGFTLVEMLIVIVIIGILAAALIPRLSSVSDKARDVARRADIQQIVSAASAFQVDNSTFPNCLTFVNGTCSFDKVQGLTGVMTGIPKDPQSTATLGEYGTTSVAGQYHYVLAKRNGTVSGGIAIVSKASTEGFANRFSGSTSTIRMLLTGGTDITNYLPCSSVKVIANTTVASTTGGACTAPSLADLRYVTFK